MLAQPFLPDLVVCDWHSSKIVNESKIASTVLLGVVGMNEFKLWDGEFIMGV